jgi:hypothetical protein
MICVTFRATKQLTALRKAKILKLRPALLPIQLVKPKKMHLLHKGILQTFPFHLRIAQTRHLMIRRPWTPRRLNGLRRSKTQTWMLDFKQKRLSSSV